MDYHAEYTLFQRNTYGIIQCLHGIQGLQSQASGSKILPFFKGHLEPILEHFNPAFMNRTLQRTNETLIRMYTSQIAQQGIWHLQKTIAKLITEILHSNLHMRDKNYITQGTISKAKKHFGTKLSPTTITNFRQCVENLWENHKCNQQIIEYLHEERGPDWFRVEFRDYLPNVNNLPRKINTGLKQTVHNSNKPHQLFLQFPREYGNLNLRPKHVNNKKSNQPGSSHQHTTNLTSKNKDNQRTNNKDNQHTNTTTNTPNRKTTTEVTCEYYTKKRQQDSEHYIRDHPKQIEAIRLINDYIDKCVEPDCSTHTPAMTDTPSLFLHITKSPIPHACTERTTSTPLSSLTVTQPTQTHARTETPSLLLHITESPIPPALTVLTTPTPLSSSTATQTDTQDTDKQDISTENLNLLILEDFITYQDFGAPQRRDVLETLKTLLIDQVITNPNLEIALDETNATIFIKRGTHVHFHFPITHPIFNTENVFDETLILLRNLPGLPIDENITFTKSGKEGRIPLYQLNYNPPTDLNWPDSGLTSNTWGQDSSSESIQNAQSNFNTNGQNGTEELGDTLDFLL